MAIKTRNKVSVNFNMSSMTDLVFLLLLFFIILSTMVSPYGAKVDLPTGKLKTKEHPEMAVSIRSDLSYNVDGMDIDKSLLEGILVQRKSEMEKPTILLKVDQQVPTGETVSFLSLAKEHGFSIVIATKPK